MKIKNILCIILCFACLLCTTSCGQDSTASQPEINDTLALLYGFSKIEGVNYYCVKNTPKSDSIYAISGVVTDSPDVTDVDLIITCKNDDIIIDGGVITVPYKYTKWHKSVKLNALHEPTGLNIDFTIKFEDTWKLVFEDEFEGTELDTSVWKHQPEWLRDKGYVNYWSKDLTFLDGEGNLVSRATPGKKTVDGKVVDAYLSGAITTKGLFTSTYGYYETRVKLHHQTGMWGAFWLVCGDMSDKDVASDNSSTNGCEIDVFESLYNHGGVAQNLHWDGFTGHTCSAPNNGYVTYIDTYDNEFHTFAVSWTPNEYVFLIDGIVTRRIDAKTAGGICNQPGNMIISTECGTWAGDWVLDEGEYSDMLVDYVRIYQSPTNSYN